MRFAAGALAEIGALAQAKLGRRVLVVTDAGLVATGVVDRALRYLKEAGVEASLYAAVVADPPTAVVKQAVAASEGATGVIGLGGGSSLDVAKLVALLAGSGEKLADVFGVAKAKGRALPLILVPTTAGPAPR